VNRPAAADVWTRHTSASQVTGRTDGRRDRVEYQWEGTLVERHRAGGLECGATTGLIGLGSAGATLFVGDIFK